jgi:hypothetical protein
MQLTPEDHARLQTKQLANVIRKLNAGKSLTAREEAILAQARGAEPGEVHPSGDAPLASGFAKSWDDLATGLRIEERSLFDFRKKHAPRIKAMGAQLTKADGRHVIAAWRTLGDELGELRGRGVNNPDADYIDERALRLGERKHALALAVHKLAVATDEVLPLTEYQAALRVTVGAFDAALQQLPGRAADKLIQRARLAITGMLCAELTEKQFAKIAPLLESAPVDHAGVIEVLDTEIEAARRALAEADFMEPQASE